MEMTTLNVRVDKELKATAEAIAQALGMNLSTAVNIFLRQMVSHDGMPFDVRLYPNAKTRQAIKDAMNEENLLGPFHSSEELMAYLDAEDDDDA